MSHVHPRRWATLNKQNSKQQGPQKKRSRVIEYDENGNVLSNETRARRKRELLVLRGENTRLRDERGEFLNKIRELELQLETQTRGAEDPFLLTENELLNAQLEEHKRLMTMFLQLGEATPRAMSTKHLYGQGAENARTYVLGLVSQSQESWIRARIPSDMNTSLNNVCFHYKFTNDKFGEAENKSSLPCKASKRIHIRLDYTVPNVGVESAANLFWNLFSSTSEQRRLYHTNDIQLTSVDEDSMPNQNTRVLHYKSKPGKGESKDKDTVFVLNRERRELAKSTLAIPKKQRKSKSKEPDEFGNVTATVVSMTTTTMYSPELKEDENTTRISSLLVQGVVIWNENDQLHVCAVFSMRDDFKAFLLQKVAFDEFVNAKGTVTKKFASEFKGIATEIAKLFKEKCPPPKPCSQSKAPATDPSKPTPQTK